MNKSFFRKADAYFTAEATMVLSATISVILLLVYIILFRYDRCLLEQDIGMLALKGCTVQKENKNDLLQELEKYKREIYIDKYVAWNGDEIIIELSGDMVRVEQKGCLRFPFTGMEVFNGESEWKMSAIYENKSFSPISFLRTYHRLIGGK